MPKIWNLKVSHSSIPHFLEISPQRDFISRPSLARRQFEGGVYRDWHARICMASIISLSVHTYNARSHTYYNWRSFIMRQDFEGGIYWDEFAETCGGISRYGEISRKYGTLKLDHSCWLQVIYKDFATVVVYLAEWICIAMPCGALKLYTVAQ